jgi:hypothetical protein
MCNGRRWDLDQHRLPGVIDTPIWRSGQDGNDRGGYAKRFCGRWRSDGNTCRARYGHAGEGTKARAPPSSSTALATRSRSRQKVILDPVLQIAVVRLRQHSLVHHLAAQHLHRDELY